MTKWLPTSQHSATSGGPIIMFTVKKVLYDEFVDEGTFCLFICWDNVISET